LQKHCRLDEISLPRHGGRVDEAAEKLGVDPQSIIDFSANMNPLAPPESLDRLLKEGMNSLGLYPDYRYKKFREAVVEFLDKENGVSLDLKNVIPGNGSAEIFRLALQALVAGGGERVLVPFPTFSEYASQAQLVGLKVDRVEYEDLFACKQKELSGYEMVFLCNPNNPTGVLREKDLLLDFVSRCLDVDTFVLLDEAFIELSDPGESLVESKKRFPNLVIVRSLTKVFTIPGLRIGYAIATGKLRDRMEKLRLPWNLNCFASFVGSDFLKNERNLLESSREFIDKEREWLYQKLGQLGFSVSNSSTNFLLFNTKDVGVPAPDLVNQCLDHNVLIRNADSFYGLDEWYVRVAVKQGEENKKLIEALTQSIG